MEPNPKCPGCEGKKRGPKPFTRDQFLKRFWERISIATDLESCWPWQGSCSRGGYGTIQARAITPKPMYAHRIMWELAFGPIPEGKDVLHKCDNPPCCRPTHFFLGDQAANNKDMEAKGRMKIGGDYRKFLQEAPNAQD